MGRGALATTGAFLEKARVPLKVIGRGVTTAGLCPIFVTGLTITGACGWTGETFSSLVAAVITLLDLRGLGDEDGTLAIMASPFARASTSFLRSSLALSVSLEKSFSIKFSI